VASVHKPRVMIATPAYGGMVHVDFVTAVLSYAGAGLDTTLVTVANESLITRGRNTLAAIFHERRDCTHLLFLDGDVHLPAAGLAQLLAHDRDVIGAPVALKRAGLAGEKVFNVGEAVGEDGWLIEVARIGTAALMLSRRAVTALVNDAVAGGHVYERPRVNQNDPGPAVQYDIFRVGVIDGDYLSEDFWACRTLRRLGFAVYVDPTIVTRHHGTIAV
jgi:hypothetical protein